jgi:hypothetical protein
MLARCASSQECVTFAKVRRPSNNGLELTRSAMASNAALAAQPGVRRTEGAMSEYDHEAATRLFGARLPVESGARRPPAATLGAVIAIVFASLGLVSGLLGLLVSLAMGRIAVSVNTPMAFAFEHFRELTATQVVFNAVILVGAANALRRVHWARRATQGLMAVWAAMSLFMGVYMASSTPASVGRVDGAFMATWRTGAILSSVLWGVCPAAAVLWLFERRSVRDWFAVGEAGQKGA